MSSRALDLQEWQAALGHLASQRRLVARIEPGYAAHCDGRHSAPVRYEFTAQRPGTDESVVIIRACLGCAETEAAIVAAWTAFYPDVVVRVLPADVQVPAATSWVAPR